MRLSPTTLKVLAASTSLLVYLLIVLRSMMRLGQEFRSRAPLSSILVCWTCNFLSRPLDIAIISQAHIGLLWSKSDHRKLCYVASGSYHGGLNSLWLWMNAKLPWTVAVHNVPVMA